MLWTMDVTGDADAWCEPRWLVGVVSKSIKGFVPGCPRSGGRVGQKRTGRASTAALVGDVVTADRESCCPATQNWPLLRSASGADAAHRSAVPRCAGRSGVGRPGVGVARVRHPRVTRRPPPIRGAVEDRCPGRRCQDRAASVTMDDRPARRRTSRGSSHRRAGPSHHRPPDRFRFCVHDDGRRTAQHQAQRSGGAGLRRVGADRRPVPVQSVQEVGQVGGGELPLERFRGLVVACFECGEPFDDDVEIVEVVGR